MATTKLPKTTTENGNGPIVLVRGFKACPYRVRALAVAENTVIVTGGDESKAIGYPADAVFEFNEEFYERLKRASTPSQRVRLWSEAKGFDVTMLPRAA